MKRLETTPRETSTLRVFSGAHSVMNSLVPWPHGHYPDRLHVATNMLTIHSKTVPGNTGSVTPKDLRRITSPAFLDYLAAQLETVLLDK